MKCTLTDEQREIAWRWYCALLAVETVARECVRAGIPLDMVADYLLQRRDWERPTDV